MHQKSGESTTGKNLCKSSQNVDTEKESTKEENETEEILSALSDPVMYAIFTCVSETDTCEKKDLITMDAVIGETESLIAGLKDLGLIDVEKDTAALTEKGRKVLLMY
jgi:hypothetical protein